jgi:glycosyltransferase involved in cell wall biosynthesis
MRVLFYYTSPEWSGSARAFAAAGAALMGRGFQVTYVCATESGVEQRLATAPFEVVSLPMGGPWPADTLRLRQVLLDNFVEVLFVHTEEEHLAAALAVRIAARGAVVRRVPAGAPFRLGAAGRLAHRLAATGYLFTTDYEPAATELSGALEPTAADVGVAVDALDQIRPIPKSSVAAAGGSRLIVCVYDAGAKRDVTVVLRTVALLAPQHPELRLAIVGPGSDDEDLRMHAAALGITPIVAHLGERDDHLAVLKAADLAWVVATSDDAAYGFLDPMAMRVPVLAERGTLSQRYVADGITGVLLSQPDAPTTAARIATLLAYDERRTAMGNAGRSRVARDFPEDAMVDGFERATHIARDRSRWNP